MRLAEECIRAGAHYVDLADSRFGVSIRVLCGTDVASRRVFVEAIGALDSAAREAGVLVASGASSVPALSSAVIGRFILLLGIETNKVY